jgi:F0F1-type ATP synthase assembly protein I
MQNPVPEKSSKGKPPWALLAGASQLGFMAVGGLGLGLWLDSKYQTSPWCSIGGLLLGFVAGFMFLMRLIRIQQK